MNRLRDPQWFLILMFLGIIGSVPLIQMLDEARQENGVRALDVFSQMPTAANLHAYGRSMETANWAARASRPWIQSAQFEWLKYGGGKVVIGEAGWFFYKPGLNYMLDRPERAKTVSATNDPLAAIVDFRDQLAARGIRFLVMPVPNKESVYPDRLTPRAASLRGVLAPRTKEILDRLRAADVEVIDLFNAFEQARQQTDSSTQACLYLAQDTHWSPAGVNLAAEVVAHRLLELDWIRPGQVDYREQPAPVRRLGDILRMLQVPQIESSINPETVPCVQVVRRDNGELYQEAPNAEVLILGDSFMRVFQRDEPGAAGFSAHLGKELKQPLMALVNDGGGSTLVRQELRGRPAFLKNKKVLLWEFVERDIGLGIEGWKLVPLPPMVSLSSPEPVKAPADLHTSKTPSK
jgi:hypothetical protein